MDDIKTYSHAIEDLCLYYVSSDKYCEDINNMPSEVRYINGVRHGMIDAIASIYAKKYNDVYNDCIRFAHSHDLLLEWDYE
ncbi:MAG: hypothetical protein K2H01_11065 [Ruminococcus sp.]|nr:hypothetical protein [Ruminococcus sp.]